jgi:hybrid cluster-associated redox disulfide protein
VIPWTILTGKKEDFMSPYMKRFVYAALFYLGVAAVLGLLNGLSEVTYSGVFAHTHFSLLGFMAMIVFGIGYFILPRFNGTELRFPGWVPVHFWLANISLIGMVIFRGLSVNTGEDDYAVLFIIFAVGQAVSLLMFVSNIWLTLSATTKRESPAATKPDTQIMSKPTQVPNGRIAQTARQTSREALCVNANTKIAELIDAAPSVQDLLVSAGLKSLAVPGHIDQVRAMGVTVGMAAARHGLDLEVLLTTIKQKLQAPRVGTQVAADATNESSSVFNANGSAHVLIGSVMEKHPQTKAVFQRHFGAGCFDCPGQMYESIDMACRMHGVNQQEFLDELNTAILTG